VVVPAVLPDLVVPLPGWAALSQIARYLAKRVRHVRG
jgi:hypothetical protein